MRTDPRNHNKQWLDEDMGEDTDVVAFGHSDGRAGFNDEHLTAQAIANSGASEETDRKDYA